MTRTTHREFDSLRIEGGIFPSEFLNAVRDLKLKGQGSTDYGLHRTLKLRDEIGRYWRIAKSEWETFNEARQRQDIDRNALAVERFLLPLLQQVFGFSDLQPCRQPRYLGERRFPLSHEAGFTEQAAASSGLTLVGETDEAPRRIAHIPLVLAGPDFALEKSHPAFGDEGRRRSPQGLLQEYLNASGEALWGIVSNGLVLRILRDNPSMTRPAFLEVDLARLFEDDLYPDFVALWLTLHASRFLAQNGKIGQCWLEQWREQAAIEGERARSDLRAGVEQALRALGGGFVAHPANQALREALSSGQLSPNAYFQQLLRLVYRLLFLLTAEDRNILHDPATATPEARRLYAQGYSLSLLRERARKRRFYDDYADLWQALTTTFVALRSGQPLLGLPALGGLFAGEQCSVLEVAFIDNKALLEAIRSVAWVSRKTGAIRINYRDMDTEELGSVYESLLELKPRVNPATSPWQFGFMDDDDVESKGSHARKRSGSYYTPDVLVKELVDAALDPIIESKIKDNPENPRRALLSIKVCDPACGSGHFLLAAARKIASRVALLDSMGDQFNEVQYRHALRDVTANCIYGVDLNPMAIELCKTALWIEALEPGRPLGFLESHIRPGNSLVGVVDPELLSEGISDGAFKAFGDDDSEVVSTAKKVNKKFKGKLAIGYRMRGELFSEIDSLSEKTIEDVVKKTALWNEAKSDSEFVLRRSIFDAYVSAFFCKKNNLSEKSIPTNADLLSAFQGYVRDEVLQGSYALSGRFGYFHWHLEFPAVFGGEKRGFDLVIGNPPWDVVKFEDDDQLSLDEHDRLKNWLGETIYSALDGKKDYYKLFIVLCSKLLGESGKLALVVPTGVFQEERSYEVRKILMLDGFLDRLCIYQNGSNGFFKDVHSSYLFSTLIFSREKSGGVCYSTIRGFKEEVPAEYFELRVGGGLGGDLCIPFFSTEKLMKAYFDVVRGLSSYPMLKYRVTAEFHASTDKIHICKERRSESDFKVLKNDGIHQFNFGYGEPIGYIDSSVVEAKLQSKGFSRGLISDDSLRLVFRDIARADDSRTLIACILPGRYVSTYDIPVIFPLNGVSESALGFYLGYMNSLVFDFLVRPHVDKHVKGYILKRLPIPEFDENNSLMRDISSIALSLNSRCDGGYGEERARLDALVLRMSGLDVERFEVILDNFSALTRSKSFSDVPGGYACLVIRFLRLLD